jgi:hypothetical protein
MHQLFNNREIATAIWITIAVFFGARNKGIRYVCTNVLKSFWYWKIVLPVVLMILYVVLCVVLLGKFALWNASLLKETIYWFLCSGFVLFMNLMTDRDHAAFFRRTILGCFKAMVFIQFLIGFYPLPLAVELLLIPLLTFVAAGSAYTEIKPEYSAAKKVFDGVLTIIGFAVLAHVGRSIHQHYAGLLKPDVIRSMLLPLWLTLSFLPFLYVAKLISEYEMLFGRLGFLLNDNSALVRHARARTLAGCHISLRKLNALTSKKIGQFYVSMTKSDIDAIFTGLREEAYAEEQE